MTLLEFTRFIHLLAAAVWTGGLIVLSALVPPMRKAGADLDVLRAAARQFARLTWGALALLAITGVGQVQLGGWPWSYPPLVFKLGLVALAVGLAAFHHLTARRFGPAVAGAFQAAIVLASIAVFAAAVMI